MHAIYGYLNMMHIRPKLEKQKIGLLTNKIYKMIWYLLVLCHHLELQKNWKMIWTEWSRKKWSLLPILVCFCLFRDNYRIMKDSKVKFHWMLELFLPITSMWCNIELPIHNIKIILNLIVRQLNEKLLLGKFLNKTGPIKI